MTLRFDRRWLGLGLAIALSSCRAAPLTYRTVQLHQQWQLERGAAIAGHAVLGSLGDISIEMKGNPIYAPWAGRVEANTPDCVLYSSTELPAYLFRLCGVERQRLGDRRAGEVIGRSQLLQFAAMRRQPDGTWVVVEPGVDIVEQMIQKP